jgi:ketopantoate hydroxymethyltransferase
VLGLTDARCPRLDLSQQHSLDGRGRRPATVVLTATDLAARHWADQAEVDWILLMPPLSAMHDTTAVVPVTPAQLGAVHAAVCRRPAVTGQRLGR